MKKILFNIYTGEYPNQFAGGPNNIIYKIISNYNDSNYHFDYLSNDLFAEELTAKSLSELSNKLSSKKKTALLLSKNLSLYRKIFGSDFYLPYHFYKKNKYFRTFGYKKSEYDIIHSQDSVALSLLANKNDSSKKIMTVHSKGTLSDELKNMAKSKKLQNKIERTLRTIELESIKIADVITFPSIAAKIFFEKSLNILLQDKDVRIIYNGVDFNKINDLNSKGILYQFSIDERKDRLLLLNIAANAPEKRIDVVLKVIEKLKHKYNKDVLLINVGVEKNNNSNLVSLIRELDIEENVKFLGKLSNTDVVSLLKATDIFLMTSEKVIFDLVVLEALASGTCCVVSNDGGNKEIIKDGENGYLINTTDVDEIAKKIISINPNEVADGAIKTAKQFSVQKMADEYFEVYASLLNGV